jgi:hypothetical protein
MVTLALTMLMMAMFASIFKIAGDFVTRQKGIGENDQSARILTTVLKTDLQARTMRFLAPFHPSMPALGDDSTNRQGYFYISENNPMDDTDDVLQFTVNLPNLGSSNPLNNGELNGLATNLPLSWQPGAQYIAGAYVRPAGTTATSQPTGFIYKTGTTFTSGTSEPTWSSGTPTLGATVSDPGGGTWTTVASAINQPDGDDGVLSYLSPSGTQTINPPNASPNNTGASQAAEVTYFLRHGNLYRRVLLIRNPYNRGGATNSQPLDAVGAFLIQGTYPPTAYTTTNTFWGDFDYAARINTGGTPGVQFLATSSLESSLDNLNISSGIPIGRPDNRFGFDQVYNTTGPGPTANGAPREYALPYNSGTNTITSATPVFFGRYTDEETSNVAFQFPGALPQVGGTGVSPMGSGATLGLDSNSYTMWLLNANPPTANQSFAKGPRRGEDILLTNVVSFDVKIWDNNYSESAGSDVNRNGIIDTGAAFADVGHTAATGDFQQANNIFPVFGPNVQTTYAVPGGGVWAPAYTYTSNSVTYNHNNVFDTWYRFFDFDNLSRTYDTSAAGTNTLYGPAPYRARPAGANAWVSGAAHAIGNIVYSASPANPANGDTANGYVYQCTVAGTSGTTNPFSLTDQVNNTITDGGVTWTVLPPATVQAIQITVKYLDPSQNLLRQVTIMQSLTQ